LPVCHAPEKIAGAAGVPQQTIADESEGCTDLSRADISLKSPNFTPPIFHLREHGESAQIRTDGHRGQPDKDASGTTAGARSDRLPKQHPDQAELVRPG